MLSFITAFGLTKAITNYFTDRWSNKIGRRNLLIVNWIFGIPVPFILTFAPTRKWILLTNVFLGMNQGFIWSSKVIMKMIGLKRTTPTHLKPFKI